MQSRVVLLLVLFVAGATAVASEPWAAPSGEPAARLDLQTAEGVAAVSGQWRYTDAELVPTQHRAPDHTGQPTGPAVRTWDVRPHAGGATFDDSRWPVVEPATLRERRGHGRVSFNWYRLNVTVPERVGTLDTRGATLVFSTSLDDYAEVWVDGELPRATGQNGGSVVAGWNATNRLVIGRDVRPGQRIQLAVFGINGPISDPPANFIWMRHAALEFFPGGPVPLAVPPQEVNVTVERLDPAIDTLVPANAKLFKLAEGFLFTEGPVWVRDGYLLFSDPNANRIYAYSEAGATLSLHRPQSGYDGADVAEYSQPGSNGLALDAQGRLTINQHGHRRVVRVEPDGQLTVLAAADREGRRLNSPNDLVYRADGSVYFTDPPFGLPRSFDDPRKEIPYSGVYRAKDGVVTLLAQDLRGPNGLAFSNDERWLYVDNWDPEAKVVLRYPVRDDGTLGIPETFADLTREVPGDEALDGLKVDAQGNVWIAGPDGLRVYSATGRHLGTIRAPRPIHNFAWGGADGRTLYLTARDRLYRMPVLVGGARP